MQCFGHSPRLTTSDRTTSADLLNKRLNMMANLGFINNSPMDINTIVRGLFGATSPNKEFDAAKVVDIQSQLGINVQGFQFVDSLIKLGYKQAMNLQLSDGVSLPEIPSSTLSLTDQITGIISYHNRNY